MRIDYESIACKYPERLKPLQIMMRRYLKINKYISFDVETTGLNPFRGAKIFAYCYGDGDTGEVTIRRLDDKNRVTRRRYKREIQALLDNKKVGVICHNYKFEFTMLLHEGYKIPKNKVWHDTMLMSQLVQNLSPSHALDYLVWELIGRKRALAKKVEKQAHARGDRWDRVDKPLMERYQRRDGEDPLLLYFTWIPVFINDTMLYLDYLNEIRMVPATVKIEDFGVTLHWRNSNKKIIWLEDQLDAIEQESIELLGKYVNFGSHPQVCKLLFDRFKYPKIEIDEQTHQPSVDKEVILKLREMRPHRILDLILMYRSYSSALSMLRSYQTVAEEDGTIHCTIKPNEASTGRQSTEDPNAQNIRKGRADDSNPYAVKMRDCFKCKSGYVYVFGDYSAIEMKLIIEAAKSKKMMGYMKKGINPHIVACKIFYGDHLPKAKRFISKAESRTLYDYGKNGHFCLGYGGGPDKFSATLKLPMEEALPGMWEYQDQFPEIAFLTRDIGNLVKRDGFIQTPFGRKLYLPRNKSYAGLNYLIQGTAAGILKRAQIAVDDYLHNEWDDQVRVVIPIHDELIIAIPRYLLKYKDEILYNITQCMIEIPFIEVPLEVEWKKSFTTWDNTIPFSKEWHDKLYRMAA